MNRNLTVLVLITILGFPCLVSGRVAAVFDEILKPNRIYLDRDNIYITERTTIFVYSMKNYSLVKKFGGNGEGPGEFKVPLFLVPMEDNLLISSVGKISFFSKQGEFLKEIKNESGSNYFYPLKNGFVGSTYTQEKGIMYFTVNLFNRMLEKGIELYREQTPIRQPGKIELFRRAFMHKTYKDRIYVTGKEGFVLDCISRTGELIYTIKREHFKKHKITATDRKNADKYFKIRYGDSYEEIKERITYPDYFPEIRSFYVVDDKIYILPYEWKDDALKFFIYNINGEFLTETYVPLVMKYSMQPFPFTILNDRVYQLIENDSTEDWELHINDLKS
jgi:hypothetical protein